MKASYSISPTQSPVVSSASSTSTTRGGCLHSFSAWTMTGANSRSTNSTLAWAKSSMKAIVAASRRVLSVLSTAPSIAGP
jgi:hypothetical protein